MCYIDAMKWRLAKGYLQRKIDYCKASIETLPDSIDKLGYAFSCLNNTQMNYMLRKSIILHISVTPNILSQSTQSI